MNLGDWLLSAMWLFLTLGPMVSFLELLSRPRSLMCSCPFESGKFRWGATWHLQRPLLLFIGAAWSLNAVARVFGAEQFYDWVWVGLLAAVGGLHLWRWHKHPKPAKVQDLVS
jgi:hypothetical protein